METIGGDSKGNILRLCRPQKSNMSSNSKGIKFINVSGNEVQDSKFDIPTTTIWGLECIFT